MAVTKYQIIRPQVGGLKCDRPGCGFKDETVPLAAYPHCIDMPCPNCGANLLTRADFEHCVKMLAGAARVNAWANRWLPQWLLRRWHVELGSKTAAALNVELNGTGKAKYSFSKSPVNSGE